VSAPVVPAPGGARSLWLQEALAHDPGAACPPLDAHVSADVCIVGGGFAGLWAAVSLTECDPSLRIVLLERDIVGGGASGRNGGFFSSSWLDLPALVDLFGETEGLRYAQTVADAVVDAEAFCGTHGIDAAFHREGIVFARTGAWQDRPTRAQTLADRLGVGDRLVPLDGEAVCGYADSPRFVDGTFLADNAVCQPARLARGLRRVLLERGVQIHEGTEALAIEPSRPAVVRTDRGAVRADHVVLTTGAWAAGWPGFRRSFAVIADYVVATEPIPDRLADIGWTGDVGFGDAREWLYYLRPTDDGRIVIGGGVGTVAFGGGANARGVTHDARIATSTARGLLWLFPQLEGVRFTHAWGGPIDQTATFLPFVRTRPPGNVVAALGFSGHGLSQTMVAGRIVASTVLGRDEEWTSLPINRPEVLRLPPEPLRYPALLASARALARGDAREEAGRPRGPILSVVGGAPLAVRDWLVRRGAR
jgi:glycine/D-amino acid oxidase-like deaminating enzyme